MVTDVYSVSEDDIRDEAFRWGELAHLPIRVFDFDDVAEPVVEHKSRGTEVAERCIFSVDDTLWIGNTVAGNAAMHFKRLAGFEVPLRLVFAAIIDAEIEREREGCAVLADRNFHNDNSLSQAIRARSA